MRRCALAVTALLLGAQGAAAQATVGLAPPREPAPPATARAEGQEAQEPGTPAAPDSGSADGAAGREASEAGDSQATANGAADRGSVPNYDGDPQPPESKPNKVSVPREFIGKNVVAIEIVHEPRLWARPFTLNGVRVGQAFSPEIARRALDELADTGRFGDMRVEVEARGAGIALRLHVVARRVIVGVRISGIEGDPEDLLRAANARAGAELLSRDMPEVERSVKRELARRGYPDAVVFVDSLDTDDPLGIVLTINVERGAPERVAVRRFSVWPDPNAPGMRKLLGSFGVKVGDRADLDRVESEAEALETRLRAAGFHEARVQHSTERGARGAVIDLKVYAGLRTRLQIEGMRRFDVSELEAALDLPNVQDRAPSALAERLRAFYVARGLLDASIDVRVAEHAPSSTRTVQLRVHEGKPVRVIGREYPCLGPERTPADIGSEVDSFLSELPGGTLLEPVDAGAVDATFGPRHGTGVRPAPYRLNPWSVYSPEVYDKAAEHLKELFRSEGYLSAGVGPVFVQRRRCQRGTMDDQCIPVGPRVRPQLQCSYDAQGLPAEEPAIDPTWSCVEDRAKGVYCEPEVILNLPIKLGPRSMVQGVEFDGNASISDAELLTEVSLPDGSPLSQTEVDRARRRLLDRYQEEGFAFAEVDSDLEFSPDHRSAKVRFLVSERKRVRVSRIVVRGARTTSEGLIRSRIALGTGELYRRSLVRKTEERLNTLGVFSGVNVALEDPYVPASEKVVVITIQEKKPQYLDVRPGFSTGEGFRILFEYGHRNLAGQGIQLTLRSQLGFLPPELIIESDVRRKYERLGTDELLERRNTATVDFPDIGLGPLFRLRVEGVDVRDNSRDFGLSKEAGILSLFFLPERRLSFQLATSIERNDATIFDEASSCAAIGAFRVPQVPTFVVAQRVSASWDRRDNPLDATSGTFISASAEYVRSRPLSTVTFCAPGHFIRYTNRIAGYVRLSKRGLALAASFRWGFNQQLSSDSNTYPDRLFFLGGIDSLRGFTQDSLVPEDLAQRVISGEIPASAIPLRGGDLFVNPRLELRIPLSDEVQTALFVDAGNLWTEPSAMDLTRLRYATGTGLRIATPIGPLVFDYGFNVDRVIEEILGRPRKRSWETGIGAFQFSVGLF